MSLWRCIKEIASNLVKYLKQMSNLWEEVNEAEVGVEVHVILENLSLKKKAGRELRLPYLSHLGSLIMWRKRRARIPDLDANGFSLSTCTWRYFWTFSYSILLGESAAFLVISYMDRCMKADLLHQLFSGQLAGRGWQGGRIYFSLDWFTSPKGHTVRRWRKMRHVPSRSYAGIPDRIGEEWNNFRSSQEFSVYQFVPHHFISFLHNVIFLTLFLPQLPSPPSFQLLIPCAPPRTPVRPPHPSDL